MAAGDPAAVARRTLRHHKAYVAAVKAAAEKAVAERFLLRDDADRLIAEAEASGVLAEKR